MLKAGQGLSASSQIAACLPLLVWVYLVVSERNLMVSFDASLRGGLTGSVRTSPTKGWTLVIPHFDG